MLEPTYISAGNSVASGPMNSSERSKTGFALATASNLSALYIRNQTRRRRSASIGSAVSWERALRLNTDSAWSRSRPSAHRTA